MIKNQPIIAVQDVELSTQWYQALLNCKGTHGGSTFEMLTDENDAVFLCLHKWGEHEHPTLSDPGIPPGNGLILYLQVQDLDKVWNNATELKANTEESPHLNPNSGKRQFCLRDPDGYYLMITL